MSPKAHKGQPIVLSIAGYDPSSGAGVTADIKTIAAHRCYGVSCITALTVQSTNGVKRVEGVDGRIITEMLEELVTDVPIAAVHIGMLGTIEAARSVAAFIRRNQPDHVVLDPILKSSSGADLVSRDAAQFLKDRLLPLAHVITPNIDEAAALTGLPVKNLEDMEAAASQLQKMGARNVIITGGHLNPPVDFLKLESNKGTKLFEGEKITGSATHGTGCAFATAVACNLALGMNLSDSTKAAKEYVTAAIKKAHPIGKGKGPINHFV
jgi:hydroxymethylpyrimidine/phosphomethylpyrimidine kinase